MRSEGSVWGCQGGGVCLLATADLSLDVVLSSLPASRALEGSPLLWFVGDD